MELLTVVNRTKKTLEVMWDGKVRQIPVGKSQHRAVVARKAKEQNILMGSQDPRTGSIVYLVGVEEWKDDCSPIDDTPWGIERFNRKLMPGGEAAVQHVLGRTGYMSMEDNKLSAGTGPVASTFEPNPASAPIPEPDKF